MGLGLPSGSTFAREQSCHHRTSLSEGLLKCKVLLTFDSRWVGRCKEKVHHVLGEALQPRQQHSDALGAWTRPTNADVVKPASEPGALVITGEEEAPAGHVSASPKPSVDGGA